MFLTIILKPQKIILALVLLCFFALLILNYHRSTSIPSHTTDMEFIVVVDPGHGSIDTGTSYGDILEKDINLAIAKYLYEELKKVNIIPIMTRIEDKLYENDRNKDLRQRPIIANNARADLFISIHANNFPSSKPAGSQIFYKMKSEKSEELAAFIQEELIKLREENRRVLKKGDYYVLNAIKCPGVLIEVGFLSNPEDRVLLTDPAYQQQIAVAIKDGIINYFQENFGKPKEEKEEISQPVNSTLASTDANRLYYLYYNGQTPGLIKNKMSFPVANFFKNEYSLLNFQEIMALSALEQLMKPPVGLYSPLPSGSTINFLKVENRQATIDLSFPAAYNFKGGAEGELYAIEAISRTILSIKGIEKLEILIDGKKGQSPGGHILLDSIIE